MRFSDRLRSRPRGRTATQRQSYNKTDPQLRIGDQQKHTRTHTGRQAGRLGDKHIHPGIGI
eukprot:11516-Eustigmatos_ZCMA.PRE.1